MKAAAQLGSSAARGGGKCNHGLESIAQAGASIFQGWESLRQQVCTLLGELTEWGFLQEQVQAGFSFVLWEQSAFQCKKREVSLRGGLFLSFPN